MNQEMKKILEENVGNSVCVNFNGTNAEDYRSGIIKEVTDSLLKIYFYENKEDEKILFTTYIDLNSIKTFTFQTPSFDSTGSYKGKK